MREMGKAMMGTGEATGEKRALSAAEAAIANPLIDDASMKGAKGLLISITGGKDLTLYEVDEAATRIREEVDQDANIIVGATFDETLDGTIRVSVVATGIDQAAMAQRPVATAEARIAEVTQKLRADAQRHVPLATPVAPAVAPAASPEAIERAAHSAVAAALMTSVDDVMVRPLPQPKPTLFPELPAAQASEPPAPRTFVPPAAEHIPNRPRMPRIDELPLPAQRELRAKRGEPLETDQAEKRKGGLLRRLADIGLRRRDEAEEGEGAPRDVPTNVRAVRPVPRPVERAAAALPPMPARPPAARPPEPRGPEPVSDYAKRPAAHQALDPLGRPAPVVHNTGDDDQLEIPAFLRRQAN